MSRIAALLLTVATCAGVSAMDFVTPYNNTTQQQAEIQLMQAQTQALLMWKQCVQAAEVAQCGPPPQIPGRTTDYACVERQLKAPYYGQDSDVQRLAAAFNSCSR